MAEDMPLEKEDTGGGGGSWYRQLTGEADERPEVTEMLLAKFVEDSHVRSSARHSPSAVAGRIAGLLKTDSVAPRVFRDLEFSNKWQVLRRTA